MNDEMNIRNIVDKRWNLRADIFDNKLLLWSWYDLDSFSAS